MSVRNPGVIVGIVIDNCDPEGMHRVKVKYPVESADMPESSWCRMLTPMAGKQRGWVSLPEIDDEVVLGFAYRSGLPYVLGALFNGEDTPPYANDDGNNDLRVFQSRSGHRLTFDDTDGSERVELISHNEEVKIILDSSGKEASGYAGQDVIFEAGSTISLKCTDFAVEASGTVDISASSTADVSGSTGTVDGGGSISASAGQVTIG
jgi:uncharacterized protein involved in type VI secretion and phage assembly